MARIIQMLRGLKSRMPTLKPGQIALTTDEHKLYVGSDDGANHGVSMDGHTHDPVSVGGIPIVTTYTPAGGTDGKDYAVNITGIDTAYPGLLLIIIPHISGSTGEKSLYVNGVKNYLCAMKPNTNGGEGEIPSDNGRWLIAGYATLVLYKEHSFHILSTCLVEASSFRNPVFPDKGGTGLTSIAVGAYLVGNGTTRMQTKTPEEVRQHIGAAKHYSYNVTIPTSGWTAASVGWYKDITVSGVTADMEPSGGVIKSDDVAAAELQQEAWDCINRITTGAGKIRAYCYHDLPKVQITIQLVGTVP